MTLASVPGFALGLRIVKYADRTVEPTWRGGFAARNPCFMFAGEDIGERRKLRPPAQSPTADLHHSERSVEEPGQVVGGHGVTSPNGSLRASSLADGPCPAVAGGLAWQGL